MSSGNIDTKKRRMLVGATTGLFAVGTGFTAVPFIRSMSPSERAKAAGAPVEVDLSKMEVGQRVSTQYRGRTIWVVRRSQEALKNILSMNNRVLDPNSDSSEQPEYCKNPTRSIEGKEEFLVVDSHCTHLGCIPSYVPEVQPQQYDANWKGGLYCPCHGSLYDLAGRVYPGVPAPKNLRIPKHAYLSDTRLIIGLDPDEVQLASAGGGNRGAA